MLLEKNYPSATTWWETGLAVVLTRQRGMFHVNIARDKWQTATTQAGAVINDKVPQARVRAKTLWLGFAVSTETKQEGNNTKHETKLDSHGICTPDNFMEHQSLPPYRDRSEWLHAHGIWGLVKPIRSVPRWKNKTVLHTQDVNSMTVVVQEPIKSFNLCPNFHLIFKRKKKRLLLQLRLYF